MTPTNPDRAVTDQPEERRSRVSVFAEWHRTEKLWQDIYTRTVSALLAALVVYLVAALSGVVTRKPLPVLCGILSLLAIGQIVLSLRNSKTLGPGALLPAVGLFFFVSAGLMSYFVY